jgi:hypothetical protein
MGVEQTNMWRKRARLMLVTLIELADLENFTNLKVCFDADLLRDFARICLGRMPTEVLAGYQ